MADDSYKKEFLEAHNQYREQHQAPPLVYSEDLCKTAQLWADHMLEKRSLGHSDTVDGENVYYSFSSTKKTLTGKEAVDSWYSEIKDYDFKKSGHQPKTGHFTQVVWKSSTELGVGLATDGNTVFVVGQYKPAGNMTNAGYYEQNVLPKTGYDSYKKESLETHNQCHEQHQAPPLVNSEDYDSYKKEFLEAHNQYREQHQAPPLVYSEDLCKTAQLWADHMLEKRSLGHSDTVYGENVYYSFSSTKKTLTGKEAVDSWYSEIKDYDFKKSGHQPKTGHFTQVVWKSSTELGVGLATDGNTVFVVGQYKPAGNMTNAGYYEQNVLPKTGYDSYKKESLETHNKCREQHQAPPLVNSEDYDSYKKEFLEAHNQYREQHQAPPLVYSEDLCKTAQLWADHMLEKRSLGHSDTVYGENVYYSFSSTKKTLTGKEAVDSWYSEIKDYDFKKSGHQPKTGHFTQVVWKSSTELGVGLATDGNTVFVVGQYKPAGNMTNAGYYEQNVLPKTGYDSYKKESLETHNQCHEQHQAPPLVNSEDYDSYKKEFLEAHNQYREQHQAPPLVYSEDLCKTAQLWADHMLEKRSLGHSDTVYGENVYYSFSSTKKTLTGKEAVDSWYSEIKDYDFKKSGHQPKTGHFTQVVWKSSTELGVGLATDGNTVFVVGQYKPAGNMTNAGYYEQNVLPKTGYDSYKKESLETHNQCREQHQAPPLVNSEDYDSYKKEFLEAHNQYREQHQAPPLVYSEDLCKTAQLWADHMLEKRSLGHSDTDDGENVYYSFSSTKKTLTGKEAVDSWYSEIKDYDFKKSGHQPKTGHFTQVVWKSSTELGVGLATDGNTVFVVGQYKPAGNMTNAGYYEQNVLPKTG